MTSRPIAASLILAFVASVDVSRAQTGRATVRVLDQNGAPVPHAVLEIRGAPVRVTDDSGRVEIVATADSLTLSARRIGHKPFFGKIGIAFGGETVLTLPTLAQRVAAVTVTAKRPATPLERAGFYDRVMRAQRGAMNADFITPEELDARPGVRTSDLFHGRRFVFPTRTSGLRPQAYLKGRGGCKMSILLDGHLMSPEGESGSVGRGARGGRMAADGIVPLDDIIGPADISAVEIYASANQAPAELIPLVGMAQQASCGIVAVWTGGRR